MYIGYQSGTSNTLYLYSNNVETVSSSGNVLSADRVYARNGYDTTLCSNSGGTFLEMGNISTEDHPT